MINNAAKSFDFLQQPAWASYIVVANPKIFKGVSIF